MSHCLDVISRSRITAQAVQHTACNLSVRIRWSHMPCCDVAMPCLAVMLSNESNKFLCLMLSHTNCVLHIPAYLYLVVPSPPLPSKGKAHWVRGCSLTVHHQESILSWHHLYYQQFVLSYCVWSARIPMASRNKYCAHVCAGVFNVSAARGPFVEEGGWGKLRGSRVV